MSYAARLVHTLTHVRVPLDDRVASRDEYGQPTPGEPVRTTVRGLVQPRTGSEAQHSRDAGTADSDHVIFLQRMTLDGSDWFEFGGGRFDIRAVRDFAFGGSPHMEVDARRFVSALPAESTVDAEGS